MFSSNLILQRTASSFASVFRQTSQHQTPGRAMSRYGRLKKAGTPEIKHSGWHHRDFSAAASRQQQHVPTLTVPPLSHGTASGAMDVALDSIGVGRFHVFLLMCVSLIWAGDAMEVMVLSYLGPAAGCAFDFSATQQSLLSSVVFGGMVLGAASWGVAADALGRRKTLLTSCGVIVAAGLASAAAPNYEVLLLSRACVGFGLAGAPVAFTLLIELLPAASRGTWGTLVELAWTAGTVLEALLAWWLLNAAGWRPLLLLSVAPLVLLLILGQYLPESPRYLLAEGDAKGAQEVLQQIAQTNGKHLVFAAAEEYIGDKQMLQQPAESCQHCVRADDEKQNLLSKAQLISSNERPVNSSSGSSSCHTSTDISQNAEGAQVQQQQQQQLHHAPSHALGMESHESNQQAADSSPGLRRHMSAAAKPIAAAPQQQQQQQPACTGSASSGQGHMHKSQIADGQHQPTCQIDAYTASECCSQCSPDQPSPTAQQAHAKRTSRQQHSVWQHQLQLLLSEVKLAASTLSRPPYRTTTMLLLCAWVTTTFTYYGLVQLVAQLHLAAGEGGGGGTTCMDGMLQVPNQEYVSVLVTSAAEVPAVAWAAVSTNWLGRRASIATSLALTAVCLVPCMAAAGLGTAGVQAAAAAASSGGAVSIWHEIAPTLPDAGMFGARLFIMAAFTLLWVFTPELFPTHVRAVGLGINNAFARIGGLLSPFAAINLVSLGAPAAAEGLFAAAALAACAAVLAISSRHDAGQPMEEDAQLDQSLEQDRH